VSYTLTFALPRDVAERLTAQAIGDGKNIEAVEGNPRVRGAADGGDGER
jgi:hypothetical protein